MAEVDDVRTRALLDHSERLTDIFNNIAKSYWPIQQMGTTIVAPYIHSIRKLHVCMPEKLNFHESKAACWLASYLAKLVASCS